jgi:hypothetical protein
MKASTRSVAARSGRLFLLTAALWLSACGVTFNYSTEPFEVPAGDIQVSFGAAADMREYTGDSLKYFRGACERLAYGGPGDFMISPGDFDPPARMLYTLQTYVASDYPWYPAAGNHETETASDMDWLRSFNAGSSLPNIVNSGPAGCEETTYSFEIGGAHFVVLNEYYDGVSDTGGNGDVVDELYDWLVADLDAYIAAAADPIIFVVGHEPAYPQPDEENGRLRHETDSLNAHEANRDRFWQALAARGVTAYICGHTHNYSAVRINAAGVIDGDGSSVWQIDVGHARGLGDTGARSTFLMLYVMADGSVWCYTYRLTYGELDYVLTGSLQLR